MTNNFKHFILNLFLFIAGIALVIKAIGYALITLATPDPHAYQKVYCLSVALSISADVLFYFLAKSNKKIWRTLGVLGILFSLIPFWNFTKTYSHVFH